MFRYRFPLMVCLAAIPLPGCTIFNDACALEPSETWGALQVDLDVRSAFVGQCEAPVGNLLTDALLHFDYDVQLPAAGRPDRPTLAIFPAGLLTDRITCDDVSQVRSHIAAGTISGTDIELLLADPDDRVVILDLAPHQIDAVFERAVSRLGQGADSQPADFFLQVSGELGVRVEVDCTQNPQDEDADGKPIPGTGERIVQISLGPSLQGGLTSSHYVAAPMGFLTRENLGFSSILGNDPDRYLTPYRVSEVIHDWLAGYASSSAVDDWTQYPQNENRFDFVDPSCLAGVCRADGESQSEEEPAGE